MALWPFIPTQISETLKYYTDVRMARSAEYRDSLHNATQVLTYSYVSPSSVTQSRLEQTFKNNIAGNWEVPIWHFATEYPSGLAYGETTFLVEDADFRVGGQALVYEDASNYEVINIETYTGGYLALPADEFLSQSYGPGVWIVPLVPAIVPGGMSRSLRIGTVNFGLTFYVTLGEDLAAANYPLRGVYDIISESPSMVSDLDGGLSQDLDFIDNGFGAFALVTNETYTRWRGTLAFTDVQRSTRWARRQHLDRCRGKDRPFFLPTFQEDLTLNTSATSGATTVSIVATEVVDAASLIGRYVYIERSGVQRVARISNVGGSGPYTLTLDVATGVSLPAGHKLSFAHLVRYDTDTFDIQTTRSSDGWVSSYSGSVVEVPS